MTPWEIRATEFANCNCAYGCPCQFNAPPTYGHCQAVVCNEVISGHHGDVKLDGLRFGGVFSWPGAIHEGNGKAQPFVDERATEEQRDAILRIMSGEDTDPMATVFAVFASTLSEVYDPIFAPIAFEVDVEARRGHFVVPGVAECHGEPIRNPVTGAEHRARIDLPNGFEYEIAEMGSGSSKTHGKIELTLANSYGQFARLHLNNHGVIKHRAL
ncbi:DUF1326 domain-containing protein [Hyphomicrobium sp.]|uniref:DUF1326 domain-containing protein n=1 Tax=Hyphomicrobium sp. TaxID=82 RepID=UPI002E368A91|nr:DUF1326 domain-containing protein [Hyphomicrobium sp.]HEX2842800.1 DUF1326 domain-containing protein [Hyphomicrobium sp.]